MARLSKKLKREWDFFISPKTGRRTYNDLCRKCRNDCKQSFRAIVVCCPMYCSKRSVNLEPIFVSKLNGFQREILIISDLFNTEKRLSSYLSNSPFNTIQIAGNRINI